MREVDEFFEAIKRGDRSAVERRLSTDPALAGADLDGTSAVLVAAYHAEPEIARLLAQRRADLTIFEAAAIGDAARVHELVEREPALSNAFAPDGFQPLGLAAFFRHPHVVRYLVERGADPSSPSRNSFKVTPLHSAVADGGHAQIARDLIEAGADVNVRQRHGWTPLHGAAEGGDRATVELLLARGADASAANDDGKTALDVAREKGHLAIAELIERAASGA